jgi:hypothetical protein
LTGGMLKGSVELPTMDLLLKPFDPAILAAVLVRAVELPLREPQVGNFAREIVFVAPDGYRIRFSSPTDLPEETLLSDGLSQRS